MRCKIFMLLLCIVSSLLSVAKDSDIKGRITDSKGTAVVMVNMVLLRDDGKTLVRSELSSEDGSFAFEQVPNGNYLLKVQANGFELYGSDTIRLVDDVDLGNIQLKPKANALKEVAVRAQRPLIEVQADKLVMNVENSIISAGSSALEVLGRAPGVRVDQNDNISLKGKQGVNVMIDGKITPVSGADLANILKSMPASIIDKIELISNPGARYDAAGNAGIINIRTKKKQKVGLNGSVNATYAQGVYPKFNTGFNLNYRNKKVNLYANYSYAYRYWFNHLMLNRRFYGNSGVLQFVYDQDNFSLFDFKNQIASGGIDYSMTKRTTIGLSVNGGDNKFAPKADNYSKAQGSQLETIYLFQTKGRHKNKYNNYATNGYLRHSFDSMGRELSVDIDYARYSNQSNQNFETLYRNVDGNEYQPPYYMTSDLSGVTQIRSLKADYSNPVGKDAKLDVGVKGTFVTADNKPLFYEKRSIEYELDTQRSNHFIYNEYITAGYANFNKEWEKWGTQMGVRVEHTNAVADQVTLKKEYNWNYTQLFPSLAVQRHINPTHDIGVTLSRRIQRPNYDQLNPFKFFIDKTTYREGYPFLIPALAYSVELSHTYKQKFITSLTYYVTNNVIVEVIQPSETEDSVTVQTNKNLKRMNFYGISGAYPFQITRWWSNVTNFNAYYAEYEGTVANTNINNGAPTFDVNTTNTFILPYDMSAELGFWYQARQVYGFMDVKPNWMLNAGVQKNFFDKKATLRFNIQDIFFKGYPRATSTYNNYQEDFIAVRDTRQASVSFTYRFGKRTVPAARRRAGGAEDEKRRANSNGA